MTQQETLEEAARTYGWRIKVNTFSDPVKTNDLANSAIQDFTEGAKWLQEKMYSEEEVFNLCREFAIFVQRNRPSYKKQQEWFNQFKKK